MTDAQQKLIDVLKNMFQLDQADLDFGIYRIMAIKHDEITTFLEKDLPEQINIGLTTIANGDTQEQIKKIEKEIDIVKNGSLPLELKDANIKNLEEQRIKLAAKTDLTTVENDIYNHLTNFFSRYYDEGDFISQRRYKDGVYAIPYEGEEVKLHWANADQYYIKTTEYFKDYAFKISTGKKVHFKIVEAETDKDNNKSGKNRTFQLYSENPFELKDANTLVINIEYKLDDKKQPARIQEIMEAFSAVAISQFKDFNEIVTLKDKSCVLEKQLKKYTARNTFDYFIHKDLGKFLNRELDFYIKNDVIFLDDIDIQDDAKTKAYLIKAKVIRTVAKKIITLLAQIEDFQKKLFLKKKFVTETNYCITLDRIPETLYTEIATNDAQREEWVKLFAIDEITEDTSEMFNKTPYSKPLTVEFLKENQFLVLDTKFFSPDFKESVVDSIDDFDTHLDGLLIHSENFQALNLLQERYKEQINCCYIDPPYNTGEGDFIYKDNYRDSSWLSMLNDRLRLAKKYFNKNGRFFCSIDDRENSKLLELLFSIFGKNNYLNSITWEKRTKSQNTKTAKKLLQSKIEYIHPFKFNDERQEFKLEIGGIRTYPYEDKIDKYRLQKAEMDSLSRPHSAVSMVYSLLGIMPKDGKTWKFGKLQAQEYIKKERIQLIDGWPTIKIYKYEEDNGISLPFWSHFFDKDVYGTAESGLNLLDKQMGFGKKFQTVKPIQLISKLLFHSSNTDDFILDFFAGSATTAHATIKLNREDNGNRKYILCEMGDYFNLYTKPRVQKVIYSEDWKNGKPVSRKGSSHAFKYISLESYEDTLNNIELEKSQDLDLSFDKKVHEEYTLSYMLHKESAGSPCLLNIDSFVHPFTYKLNITKNLESKEQVIDVVETFNYLIGLKIEHSYKKVSFNADFITGEQGAVTAILKEGDSYTFKMIEGMLLSEEKVLVIWRDLTGDMIKDNAVLDAYFAKKHINTADFEFKKIYVNGDNNLQNSSLDSENWKVVLIEEEMKKRMFEERGI